VLRAQLAGLLRARGAIRSAAVAAAFDAVPRHLFAPEASPEQAYADEAVITQRDERGLSRSSVSAPWLQATMLEQAQIRPGMRVLEIGSGGYNAALIAELTGEAGEVTTMDIDPYVTGRATRFLAEAGYGRVNVVLGDAEEGMSGHAPYDRIIVTAGAWDIPPAWREQLADGGQLVVPLRIRGLTRCWALEQAGGHLAGRKPVMCGFVPMQGAGGHQGRSILLHEAGVSLWTDEELPVDASSLGGILEQPPVQVWTGVTIGEQGSFADQDLWLTAMPDFTVLTAEQAAVDQGLVTPSWRIFTPALASGGSLAYRTRLRPAGDSAYEFGVRAHGPDAAMLADRLAGQIRAWDAGPRSGGPVLTVLPSGTAGADVPGGFILDKRHSKIVISWPPPGQQDARTLANQEVT